jgi:hypothetical protein
MEQTEFGALSGFLDGKIDRHRTQRSEHFRIPKMA